ncbi:MAG: hypothetical protein OXC68_07560 [Aestuariivita sp.]|nr:hypothetical protein [Aestuariivita sp.]
MNVYFVIGLVLTLCLVACGRPLTETERAFVRDIHGDSVDLQQVRIAPNAFVGALKFRRPVQPRFTCRTRIFPPKTTKYVKGSAAAAVYFNQIFFRKDWYTENYMPNYPGQYSLPIAMLLAHELTHVWQWQNRDITGYHPLKAATEHARISDPYLFDSELTYAFLDYGYEQQGAIMEEYICCRSIAPDSARTKRLHEMIRDVIPVSPLPTELNQTIKLPWKGAKVDEICR